MLFAEYPYMNFSDLNMDWILKVVKEFTEKVDLLEGWKTEHEREYEELKSFQDAIKKGEFPTSVVNAFYDWMRKNALDILGEMSTSVFFGLTDGGYFVAYIPESWDDIEFFTTDYDIDIPYFNKYGHLVLAY